ncbi:helix-turn-helix transcriptional regulator [Halomarina salina]|uniref:Helix-turn-helix transcriptional regulator n=1 Tax=Halomarina salina TaxID=1872699 RepID=A0ABD5RJK2_9EURY|nr:transcriptional regulator FilR1 domain-containing protein [Halomarina salina]
MDTALEEIEFLARSENRVAVLRALDDAPATRRELGDRIDASQPTLGRVLNDLADRQWISYDGTRYEATATGRLVAEQFTALSETLATELRLRPVVEWLPEASMGFDLRHLADATITIPTQTKPGAPVHRVLELLRATDHVRIVSHALNEQSLDVVRRRVVAGEQSVEGVFSQTALDAVASDDALRGQLRDLLASPDAEIRLHDERVPLAVTITDDRVHLLLRDDDGFLRAAVDTDDEVVRDWAEEAYDRYWAAATPLDPSDLDADSLG